MTDRDDIIRMAREAGWHDELLAVTFAVPLLERFAALVGKRAAAAEPDAYGYASRLAVAIWEKHYKDTAPQWKPFDDLMGVLTQIDNMTSGLAQQVEPVQPIDEALDGR